MVIVVQKVKQKGTHFKCEYAILSLREVTIFKSSTIFIVYIFTPLHAVARGEP